MTLFAEEEGTPHPAPGTPRPVKCRACPKTLTDPVSIARGYGPCCARKRGLIPARRPRGVSVRTRAGGDVEGQADLLAEEE